MMPVLPPHHPRMKSHLPDGYLATCCALWKGLHNAHSALCRRPYDPAWHSRGLLHATHTAPLVYGIPWQALAPQDVSSRTLCAGRMENLPDLVTLLSSMTGHGHTVHCAGRTGTLPAAQRSPWAHRAAGSRCMTICRGGSRQMGSGTPGGLPLSRSIMPSTCRRQSLTWAVTSRMQHTIWGGQRLLWAHASAACHAGEISAHCLV